METSQNYISEKVRNSSNVVINPATQELQTALNDKDFATAVNQSTLENLTQSLYELVERLSFLAGAKGVLADLRVTPTGTVTTTGTISTMTNQSQTGGYFTNPIVQGQTNLTAVQSNIINISI